MVNTSGEQKNMTNTSIDNSVMFTSIALSSVIYFNPCESIYLETVQETYDGLSSFKGATTSNTRTKVIDKFNKQ